MYEALSLCALLFISRKLKDSGVPVLAVNIFLSLFVLWLALGFAAGYDFSHAEYDIFPLHFTEIIRALNITLVIIVLYAFMSFFAVDLVTGFTGFTKRKAICALLLTIAITLYSMAEAYYVHRKDITITTTKLPEGTDRIRIAFLVDVHLGGLYTMNHFERVMKIVDEASPDIIMLGGDIIDGDLSHMKTELAMLKSAAIKARYGAFAVNGNHEYYLLLDEDVEEAIRECGYNLLVFERAETAGLTVIGLDDMKYGHIRPFLKPEDKNRFVIVLKHRPGIPDDADGNFDLQLSGHTHGGQFWPLGYFKNKELHSRQGLTRKSGGYVYVSNGVGFNQAMMRLFAPPEVTVIDIVREN